MSLSKERFRGFGRVCSFTLEQLLKSRSNRAMLIVLFIIALASMPVMTLVTGGLRSGGGQTIGTVYFVNETALPVTLEAPGLADRVVSGPGEPGENDALVTLTEEDGEYMVVTRRAEESSVSDSLASRLTESAVQCAELARGEALGLSPELMQALQKPVSAAGGEEPGLGRGYYIQLVYSILVMMISVLSISYIIRSVVEEKVSRLVELLMVTVDPLSLILGKIVAVILYMLITLAVMLVGLLLSGMLNALIFGAPEAAPGAAVAMIASVLSGIGPATVLVAVVSLLLGVLSFALIAGLSGVGCSTMEDISGAQGVSMMILMLGYMLSIFMGILSSGPSVRILSVIPFLSVYLAPVKFAAGEIGFGVVLIGWILQAAVALLLLLVCARVYSGLLIYRGTRVKFSTILSMAFGRREA